MSIARKRIYRFPKYRVFLLLMILVLLLLQVLGMFPHLQRTDRTHYRLSFGSYRVTWNADTLRSSFREHCRQACNSLSVLWLRSLSLNTVEAIFSLWDKLLCAPPTVALRDRLFPYTEQEVSNAVFVGSLQGSKNMV